MDDILVYGKSVGEHNQHLEATLHKLQEAHLNLNEDKCDFSKPSVEFLGTLINSEGVHVSPKKVEAILEMKTPQDQTELRRFLGMGNQLSKFQPRIAELSKPLRDLLSSKSHWLWSDAQQQAFTALKESLASTPTLAHYDATRQTKPSDASSHGLGVVLMQLQDDGEWRPVAYALRAMSPTEQRYAQIEKEDYLIGLEFHIETDHKPLVPLLSSRNLEDLPARVQRFRMWKMRFTYARVAQLVEHRAVTQEVVSSTPAGPTLRVFK